MGTGGYQLGVDLGTTYTGAAVRRDGVSEIVTLGTRSATMPTVVVSGPEGDLLVGDAAERRALELPERTARQFKRRLGDTTPILLGGTPYSPQALLAAVLADVVRRVTDEQGAPPDRIGLTHPANWGPYKRELVRQVAELAGLDASVVATITEPAAAALHYASQTHLEPGSTVAVYDLGGGTFDAAVVRVDVTGAELLGDPTGIEHLGGIDFDAVVFDHVARELGSRLQPLLDGGSESAALLWRLREECARAKEALSTDADAVVGVTLPDGFTDVRITRREFEDLLRPALAPTALSMRRAVESAGLTPDDLAGVLLVGGSSRIPLVAEIVGSELGRPVLLDTHPKHAVALGAAAHAAGAHVGEVVEVIGGEVDPDARARSRWRGPAVAALIVLLASVAVLTGLVLAAADDPDHLAVQSIDDENTTTTGEPNAGDEATTTTDTTVAAGPVGTPSTIAEVQADGSVMFRQVDDNGAVIGPPIAASSSSTTAPPPPPTTASTTAPLVAPSAPSGVVARDPQVVGTASGLPDDVPSSLSLTIAWNLPSSAGSGISGYEIYFTPMQTGTATAGPQLVGSVAGSAATNAVVSVGANHIADGWNRWHVIAVGPGGSATSGFGSAVVPQVAGEFSWEAFQLARVVGLRGSAPADGSCSPSGRVCSQDVGVGSPLAAGSSLRWHEAP